MKRADFFAIVERFHTYQNPTSEAKLDHLIEICEIEDGQRVLDIGCGKGWLLHRIADSVDIDGVGVDRHAGFLPASVGRLEFRLQEAHDFDAPAESFDVGFCIGASFAIGTFEELFPWLQRFVKPGGIMAVGDIYARHPNIPEESAKHFSGGTPRSLPETCELLNANGLSFMTVIDSSLDDWDRYESLHWRAADRWLRENPNHPERDAFIEMSEEAKLDHIRYDRDALGWALFVCRKDTR